MAKINKHITEYNNQTFSGFRVAVQRKGITFVKYFSFLKMDRETALDMAILCEAELMDKLHGCSTLDDVLVVFKEFNS